MEQMRLVARHQVKLKRQMRKENAALKVRIANLEDHVAGAAALAALPVLRTRPQVAAPARLDAIFVA